MKMIEMLVDMIDDELCVSEEYIKCALKHKEDDAALANAMYSLSCDEMRHVDILREQAESKVNARRRSGEELPERMSAVWEYVHSKHRDKACCIKLMQAQYKM